MDMLNIAKQMVEENQGFMKYNNYKVEELKLNYAKLSGEVTENSVNHLGIAHGGFIFGLADTVMGMAAMSNGKTVVTVNEQINYTAPAKCKKLIATAEPIKVGKTISVYKCDIVNEKDELIANVTGTYYFKNDLK